MIENTLARIGMLAMVLALPTACSEPQPPQAGHPTTAQVASPEDSVHASANGVVTAVDAAAATITIKHGPVESLQWPAMTMKFKAPGVDLASVEAGDQVDFEFTSGGMDGTITSLRPK